MHIQQKATFRLHGQIEAMQIFSVSRDNIIACEGVRKYSVA